MALLYINLIPTAERLAFEKRVNEVAAALKTHPNWLMQVMYAESKLKPDAINTYAPFADGYATGLIQFIPDTARSLGTTWQALRAMTRVQQMDYVYKYLKPWTGKLNSYFDVYLVVFFPAAIGHTADDNWVFETKNISRSSIAKANPAININKDGMITMGEFKQYLRNTVAVTLWPQVFDVVTSKAGLATLFFLVAAGVAIWKWDDIKKLFKA